MRIFYDTEFIEQGPWHPLDLISIGMVREDGEEYYAVSSEFDIYTARMHLFLSKFVYPHLPQGEWGDLNLDHPDVKPRAQIAAEVKAFVLVDSHPQLWAFYPAYDHVGLCQLYGTMMDLPEGFPMRTRDLMDLVEDGGFVLEDLPKQGENLHKAIDDARWNRQIFRAMTGE